MKRLLFLFSLFLFSSSAQIIGQNSISGKVIDSESGELVEAANVFIANTTLGALTDEEGKYRIENLPIGSAEIIVSFIGYESLTKRIQIRDGQNLTFNFELKKVVINLDEVQVVALKEKKRKRFLNQFETHFFGQSYNASKCVLLNPNAVEVEVKNGGGFIAKADELLEIENRATGYKIRFLLEHFEKKGPEVSYSGKPLFEEMESDQVVSKIWEKNREKTYNGSKQHFLKALYENRLNTEGFEINYANLSDNGNFAITGSATPARVVQEGGKDGQKYLTINTFLQVVYKNEEDDRSMSNTDALGQNVTKLGQKAEADLISQTKRELSGAKVNNQQSFLFARKSKVAFQKNGYLVEPELLKEYGFWGLEGVADLLPMDYVPKESKKTPKKKAVQKEFLNGFELSKLQISKSEIMQGGPPRDGIPSIDNPQFIKGIDADRLANSELVLGVVLNGIAKAYPLKIMDQHEIVNDRFGNTPVVITYCPLCGSGMAFHAEIEGQKRTFGVSGLLYNSDVLLYDRETESLWSQIKGQAVSGSASGKLLSYIQTSLTTWENWKEQNPNTLVLSRITGYAKNYDRDVYPGYKDSERLLFPVANKSKELRNKELILGLNLNGKYKAYPLNKLKKSKGEIVEQFAGKQIKIIYNQAAHSAEVFDMNNELIPSVTMYWFAWFAFHPETEIYKN